MRRIFVDTGFFYALIDQKDINHPKAKNFLKNNRFPLVTTNFVFDELLTIVRYDFGHAQAVKLGEKLRASKLCSIFCINRDDEEKAWEVFCKYSDQDFSYTDCTSFAVMNRLNTKEVASFDHHFTIIGFINRICR